LPLPRPVRSQLRGAARTRNRALVESVRALRPDPCGYRRRPHENNTSDTSSAYHAGGGLALCLAATVRAGQGSIRVLIPVRPSRRARLSRTPFFVPWPCRQITLAAVMRSNGTTWPKVIAESIAIIASILFAFAIDRWWDARQAREEEIATLTPLRDELIGLQGRLSDSDNYHAAIELSARRLIAVGNGQAETMTEAEIDRALCDQLWYSSPETLDTPELDYLAGGRALDLVRDARLRRAIGALPYSISSARRPLERDYDFYMNQLLPYLTHHAVMPQIWNVNCHRPGNPMEGFPYGAKLAQGSPVSHRPLVEDRRFQGLITVRIDILAETQLSASLKEEIAECIRQIEQTLQ
jgi:hypothetical protein